VNADELADGLTQWFRGEDTFEAEASSVFMAEVLLMFRAWIKSHEKER